MGSHLSIGTAELTGSAATWAFPPSSSIELRVL